MNILTLENITKSYGIRTLFEIPSFGVDEEEKIGLIGINGTGKSTLLKIIAGKEWPDSGRVTTGSNLRINYLPQDPDFDDQATVLQQIFQGDSPEMQLLRDYADTLEKIECSPEDAFLQQQLMVLNQDMDRLQAWGLENEAKTILTKLGIVDFQAKVGTLSGGQRKRIALAGALINPADLLILDEPTNQIDNATVDWLETYLNRRKGALLMVTHDRYFLDRVVNKIIEIDQGGLYSYAGNYSVYLEKKAEREEQANAEARTWQNLYRHELAWIKKGAKARSTKQKARIDRFEKLVEEKAPGPAEKIEIAVGSSRLGKKVFELEHVSKGYGDKKLIDDFSTIFSRQERVGIIGPNGIGKTTLLKIIAGQLEPDAGKIDRGLTVKLGLFSQENQAMDFSLRAIDYIKEEGSFIATADGGTISASQMMERFLFTPKAQYTTIDRLSGGEKRRLYLLRVLMGAPNVLLLDEPTNDLDIQTLTVLEQYLEDFPGVVIAVSHDRYFLDRVVEKIFAFQGDGMIETYVGNYAEYLEYHQSLQDETAEKLSLDKKEISRKEESRMEKPKALKFSYKEQKEYETIDQVVAELEEKSAELQQKIAAAGSDFLLLQELMAESKQLDQELNEKMERWTYLNELAETMASQLKLKS